jgi:dihydrofolate reductase
MTEPGTQTHDERKVVLYTLMSLDGAVDHPGRYFAGSRPGEAPEFDSVMIDNERRIIGAQDAVLLGRHMYDEWSRYWPNVDHQPFADFINTVKKYVVTSTPLSNGWHNSEPVAGPIEDLVRDLKTRPGGDIGVHGSIQLAQSLLEAELVDELQLVVGPAFGLPGRRLFASTEDVGRLELLSAMPTPSGSVLLGYRLLRSAAAVSRPSRP